MDIMEQDQSLVDVHCHLLPGVDDGAKNIQESRKMLEIAHEEGIRIIVATPHRHEARGMASRRELVEQTRRVREVARQIDPNYKIILGTELYYSQDVPRLLEKDKIKTMGKSKFILVEFSPTDAYTTIQRGLQEILGAGYSPVLAHMERYECLLDEPDDVEYLVNIGAYPQVNARSILGVNGKRVKKFIHNAIKAEQVFFVGTDAHGCTYRRPKMRKAYHYVVKKYGVDYAEKIFYKNAITMLKNQWIYR